MTANTDRVRSADILKGIAIICVILGHLGSPRINRIVFTFHVTAFYLVTGYFMNSRRSIKDFVKQKAKTLLIPYAVTSLVIILLAALEYGIFYGPARAANEAANWTYAALYGAGDTYEKPFYIKQIGAIWFLWASFWGGVFLRKTIDAKPGQRIAAIALLFAIGCISSKIIWLPFSIQAGCTATLFMYIGWLFKNNQSAWKGLSGETKTACVLCAVLLWFSFIKNFTSFWLVHCDVGNGVRDIVGSLCASGIVLLAACAIDRHMEHVARALSWIGRHSLLILCVHNIELNIIPWWGITNAIVARGLPAALQIWCVIFGKFSVIALFSFLALRWNFVRRLFGGSVQSD